jgi:hypothetical protein
MHTTTSSVSHPLVPICWTQNFNLQVERVNELYYIEDSLVGPKNELY